jgi:signal transduction histidine kinase
MNRPVTTAFGWDPPSWLLDYGPSAVIALEGLSIATRPSAAGTVRSGFLWLALAVCVAATLLRHRAPLGTLAAILVVALLIDWGPIVILPTLLALFTVAEYRERDTVISAAVVTAIVLVLSAMVHGPYHPKQTLPELAAIGLAVAAGLYVRARADFVGGLRDRAERLEREQQLLAGQAVAEERVRIARELHDVVAHNVALMVVQAQALAATGPADVEQQAALGRVAGLGREAMSEMHRMLGVLRLENGHGPARDPQPGVRDLERLIAQTREAGLDATLTIEGEARELPPGVDLSAYRIVQEALTNVVRHAGAGHADVVLRYSLDELLVTVTDDGTGPRAQATGGHGLVGMRERVALFGGTLQTGAREDVSGYRVRTSLPTG